MERILNEIDAAYMADYLKAMNIGHPLILSKMCPEEQDVVRVLATPYSEGIKIEDTEYKAKQQPSVIEATFRVLWGMCRKFGQDTAAAPTATHTEGDNKNKPPKTLPAGVWAAQIKKYNDIKIGDQQRSFPDKMIIGAEVTLARLWFEENKKEKYTPVTLGEIIATRSFTATGTINAAAWKAMKKEKTCLNFENMTLEAPQEDDFNPTALWQIIDGLEAMRWAYTWAIPELEQQVVRWHEFLVKVFRERPGAIEACKHYYNEASMRLCYLRMNGRSFTEAVSDITNDSFFLNETLQAAMQQRQTAERPGPTTPRARVRKNAFEKSPQSAKKTPKGKGKGQSKGAGKGQTKGQQSVCNFYNSRRGCVKDMCTFLHVCSKCNKKGHPATECP